MATAGGLDAIECNRGRIGTIFLFNDIRIGPVSPDAQLLDGGSEVHWAMIRAVLTSVADTAVVPLQDVLGLGSEARFNTPGTTVGNWGWRLSWPQLTTGIGRRLRRLTELSRRLAAA